MNRIEVTTDYASFLIRLWCEPCPGRTEPSVAWHGKVEHIQSGRCWDFDTLDGVLGFLRQQADVLGASNLPAGVQIAPDLLDDE